MERHDTLLIACGSRESRDHLRSVLKTRFNLLEATNTQQMLLLLEQNLACIAAVVLDISNWDVVDESIHTDPAATALLKQLPVIIVADKESYQDLTLYFRYGAADVLPLNYDPYAMLHRIETITQLTLHQKNLEALVEEQQENLRHFSDNMVDALSAIIEYRDMESGHHILRIRNFTRILLEEVMHHCPEYGLTEQILSIISSATALHDVGKIGIPDAILNKPGKLTPDEWEIMKTHTVLGCKMLNNLSSTVNQEYLRYAYYICRHHHERWDGQGYPDQLQGDDIPICAQVAGLADCYDALTSDRVYKKAYSHIQAVNMILSGECGAFSPKLLECFKNVTDQFAQLSQEYSDGRNPGTAIADMSLPALTTQDQTVNLIEKTQAKYYCIVHYLNAFLVEIQLDTGLFQVMYNPYPELANLQGATSLRNLTDIVAQQIVIPEEEERMYEVIWQEMPKFIQQDLRRQSFYFHHQAYGDRPEGLFEMTLLRIGGAPRHPSLAVLCRKIDQPQAPSFQDGSLMANFTDCTYVCRNDSGFTLVRPGRDTVSFGGYTAEEVMTLFGGRLLDMAFPEERAGIRQEFDRQLRDSAMVRTEYRFLCKDGSIGWVVNKSRLVTGDDGQEYLQTFLYDISALKAAQVELQDTLQRYQFILAQASSILFDLDTVNMRLKLSNAWETTFGYKPSQKPFDYQMAGNTHVHPDDIRMLMDRLNLMKEGHNSDTVEIRIANIQGRYLWCRVQATAQRDKQGKLTRLLGMIVNIDSEKKAHQALEDKANRDALTHLLNKNAGKHQIERYLAQYQHDPKCALIILDLDNFKEVNDHYGHLFGDALLTQVSRILVSLFHREDIVARIGGDEFMVLVRGVYDRKLLSSQCRRLRDMLVHAFQSDALDLKLGCSIGIALCPEHGSDYLELFSKADLALYQAKAKGKNDFCFYSSGISMDYVSTAHISTPIDSDNDANVPGSAVAYHVFRTLYQAEDMGNAIRQVLTLMGKKAQVSRAYIFENSEDDAYCTNTFEWCNEGITPQIQNLQYVSYETDIPNYQDNFGVEGIFYCHDVRELPQSAYDVAAPQGIKSMLHCAIREGGKFRGYIGFDQCDRYRMWTKDEIQLLSHLSEIISAFLLRHREQERSQAQAQQLQNLQKTWSYIIDPETYEVKDIDRNIRQEHPLIQLGQPCYQTMMQQDAPCATCPLKNLHDRDSIWCTMDAPLGHRQFLIQASRITWQGKDCRRITCRRLPDACI